jgi:isoamylase
LRHRHAVLRSPYFLHGREEPAEGVSDIAWFDPSGEIVSNVSWDNPEERGLVLRRASGNDDGSATILTALFNPAAEERRFRLPPPHWPTRVVIDSAAPDAPERDLEGEEIVVAPRAVVVALAHRESGEGGA